jgi:predicted Rossmann fold flavoprotein
VVVVGGGAAGLMAAIHAAEGGREVVVVERSKDGGRKILISGGGRCNVLPSAVDERRYVTASSPNSMRKLLRSWPLAEQRRFFEETLGIPLVREEETGKLFPVSNRARDVRDGLVDHARQRGVRIWFDASVESLTPEGDGVWAVGLASAPSVRARAVIMAAGGFSVPKTGSDGTGLEILRALGHTIHPTYPALTPLTLEPPRYADLAGVSLGVGITVPQEGFATEGGFLFTHRGYSGPTVLDVSHLVVRPRLEGRPPPEVLVRWTDRDEAAWDAALQEGGGATVGSAIRPNLPSRLAETLIGAAAVAPDRPLAQLRREERARLVEVLAAFPLPTTGDEGYRKAEVTGGGVALAEVSPKTLESRLHPGLFLCGELLDAFGPIGGYNFYWAWATGRLAGRGAADA